MTYDRTNGGGDFFNMFNSRYDTQQFLDSLSLNAPFQGSTLTFLNTADQNHAKIEHRLPVPQEPQLRRPRQPAPHARHPRPDREDFHRAGGPLPGDQAHLQPFEVYTRFRQVGVQLYVTPTIAGQDTITLAMLPTVSEVIGYTDNSAGGASNPIISTREALTQVTVANKELITIGGLDQTKKITQESKIPILGDIPILGYLFKSKRDINNKVQLWFTVQPTIANDQQRIVIPELTGLPAVK